MHILWEIACAKGGYWTLGPFLLDTRAVLKPGGLASGRRASRSGLDVGEKTLGQFRPVDRIEGRTEEVGVDRSSQVGGGVGQLIL